MAQKSDLIFISLRNIYSSKRVAGVQYVLSSNHEIVTRTGNVPETLLGKLCLSFSNEKSRIGRLNATYFGSIIDKGFFCFW